MQMPALLTNCTVVVRGIKHVISTVYTQFLFLFFYTFVGCEEAGTGAAWKRRCKAERPGDDGVLSAYGAQ